jgi:hypothetical protein
MVLDKNLVVVMANTAFYNTFGVNRQETEGVSIYDIGNGQWNIAKLKDLFENIIPKKQGCR